MLSITCQKNKLRKFIKSKLIRLNNKKINRNSFIICSKLNSLPDIFELNTFAAYQAFQEEVNINPFINKLLLNKKNVYLPAYDKKTQHYLFGKLTNLKKDLKKGRFGIKEPVNSVPYITIKETRKKIDAWLIPAVGFDIYGHRLGRGAGIYDTFLRKCQGLKIGIAHDIQLLEQEKVPVTDNDVNMDMIITNRHILIFN